MCSDAEELRCRCWCNSAAVRQGYGLELRMGVVVEGRAASRAVVIAAIAPVTAGTEFRCVGVGGSTRLQISERIEENSKTCYGVVVLWC
ncbi:hypothetical protein F0562_018017 [Nyssa sinensis]|uniref:Uncharacterized protein n=1 Tax=Nyssa sinensis TaxID=561372 RepID=A0A5J4ZB78_9ASTE|nr:hypothetical protein F0562_018017 [Nyssa sinensis]